MEEKNKRKNIPQKLRFEVFKRDNFKCQYCGRCAPDVILEVDHITPVAEGGTNDILNLVTSCRDCNRGKGKVRLTDEQMMAKERQQLEELNERRAQLEMMMEWKTELTNLMEKQVAIILRVLGSNDVPCGEFHKMHVKKQILRFGFNAVYDAAQIASTQYVNFDKRVMTLGGICYNRLNEGKGGGANECKTSS